MQVQRSAGSGHSGSTGGGHRGKRTAGALEPDTDDTSSIEPDTDDTSIIVAYLLGHEDRWRARILPNSHGGRGFPQTPSAVRLFSLLFTAGAVLPRCSLSVCTVADAGAGQGSCRVCRHEDGQGVAGAGGRRRACSSTRGSFYAMEVGEEAARSGRGSSSARRRKTTRLPSADAADAAAASGGRGGEEEGGYRAAR